MNREYLVYLADKKDDNAYIAKCSNERELAEFLLHYDSEKYIIDAIQLKEEPIATNYLVFCTNEKGLETGN